MATRILSALVALPGALFLIYLGGWPFMALIAASVAICAVEISSMMVPGDRAHAALVTAACLGLVLLSQTGRLLTPEGFVIATGSLVAILLFFLFRLGAIETSGARMAAAFLAIGWVGALFAAIAMLRLLPDGALWVVVACIVSWGSDTGAYFAGRFLGKRKLYEAVSPKKTWAGAIGGVITATLMVLALSHFLGPKAPLGELAIVSALGAALGQMGDLAESLLKRSVGAKDSGTIMPGHGGLFDRVDALLFVAPWILGYALIVRGLRLAYL